MLQLNNILRIVTKNIKNFFKKHLILQKNLNIHYNIQYIHLYKNLNF